MIAEKLVDLNTGRERYSSTLNGHPYERIGPAVSRIVTAAQATNATSLQSNPSNTMSRGD
jgi:hypothetical protein